MEWKDSSAQTRCLETRSTETYKGTQDPEHNRVWSRKQQDTETYKQRPS